MAERTTLALITLAQAGAAVKGACLLAGWFGGLPGVGSVRGLPGVWLCAFHPKRVANADATSLRPRPPPLLLPSLPLRRR